MRRRTLPPWRIRTQGGTRCSFRPRASFNKSRGEMQQVAAAEAGLHQAAANYQQQASCERVVRRPAPQSSARSILNFGQTSRGNYVEPEKAAALQHKAVAVLREHESDAEIQAAISDGRPR